MRDCEKKVIRRIYDLQRDLIREGHTESYIMRFVIVTVHNVNVIGSMKMI